MSVRVSMRPLADRVRARPEGSPGDRALWVLGSAGAAVAVLVLVAIVLQIVHGASPAISRQGLGFLLRGEWAPNLLRFGALPMLVGTAVTSLIALVVATPVSLAIAIYLALLAPRAVRTIVGPLVEMLAAIPSVILGFFGILVFAPIVQGTIEPALHGALGFIPIFGVAQTTGLSVFTAGLVLTVMVVPIIASLSRDLFQSVPRELQDGAEALGATRWEVIRGVVIPTTVSGVTAAVMLGLGRALGEAIAVASVIGGGSIAHRSLFEPGNTLAARIVLEIQYIENSQQQASLFYLALILLVMGLLVNVIARTIARRYDVHRTVA